MDRLRTVALVAALVPVIALTTAADADVVSSRGSSTGIVDVALTPEGGLAGRFLDGEGRGVDGAIAIVSRGHQPLSRTTTEAGGAYHFAGLRPGVYRVSVGDQSRTVRAWHAQAAPPSAAHLLTLIRGDQVVRGQLGLVGSTVANTVGVVGGVAGAAAGGYSVTQSSDAQDEAEAAMKETMELREMMHHLMSP